MTLEKAKQEVNFTRYYMGQEKGHYESFFLRANHPDKPLAFWIRYTIFSPDNNPDQAIGELWTIFFDKTSKKHIAVKKEVSIKDCVFSNHRFFVKVADATLEPGLLKGKIENQNHSYEWDLKYSGEDDPIFDFPYQYYYKGFPKAKVLVGLPFARFNGTIIVDGQPVEIKDWVGSQNHNWGEKHTDHYAWGQVAGFENSPNTFLEVATARLKLGPIWTPFLTPIVVKHNGQEYSFNTMTKLFKRGSFDYFHWEFDASEGNHRVEGTVSAEKEDFVCLKYYNPPGGNKYCLNTKVAQCTLNLYLNGNKNPEVLETSNRAAFEILTDDDSHGLDFEV